MVNSVNNGNGPQIQPRAGGSEKGSAADTIAKAGSLSQLRITTGEMRNLPVRDTALGGRTADFIRTLSLGPDTFSSGETQRETATIGGRLRLEALDGTVLSRDELAVLDEIVSALLGRNAR